MASGVGTVFNSILAWFAQAVDFLDDIQLEIWSFNLSLMDMFSALLITGFVISVFWKGART